LAVDLVGRERELEAGRRFLVVVPSGTAALLLCGDAGIGKTVLWRQVADEARGAGFRVLTSRCVEGEMPLAFATLADFSNSPSTRWRTTCRRRSAPGSTSRCGTSTTCPADPTR
jgi:hypothetical protein